VDGFDPAHSFGPDVAARYDNEPRGDEKETVDFLSGLAGDGPALEFAVGTGRVALPLAACGIRVDGIELSEPMVARMREKPGGDALDVVLGDMSVADAPASGYRLIYLVFNTIHNLLTQDDQVRCFQNAARHLADGGVFVIEAGMPGAWLRGGQFVDAEYVGNDAVVLDVNRYDPVTQILEENHVHLSNAGVRLGPICQRIAFPSELDLMARIAGLRLLRRTGGWCGEPYTADSKRHVSVYGR
jgi:SAM-dependent methyltransferase